MAQSVNELARHANVTLKLVVVNREVGVTMHLNEGCCRWYAGREIQDGEQSFKIGC